MSITVQKEEYKGFTIEIFYDECVGEEENPINKEMGCLGEFVAFHRRYDFGNKKFESVKEMEKYAKRRKCFVFNWYMYEHSGIAFSLSNDNYPFNDRWDAGQLGCILVPIVDAKKNFGKDVTRERIQEIIEAELKEYQQYVNNEIYCINVINNHNGDIVESFGGFYDYEEVIEEMKQNIDNGAYCLSGFPG
jgi:hypothetical protein